MRKFWMMGTCLTICLLSGCDEVKTCMDGMCSEDYGVDPRFTVIKSGLTAQCSIAVEGIGSVDMETDYVPNTTWCENGGAGDQALRAQAVAVRTYAYYKIDRNSLPVKNSQGDQVYSCPSRKPSAEQLGRCMDATKDTSGKVLTYKGKMTAGFYVSGVKPDKLDSECKFTGNSKSDGWVSVQSYVTYNWGKSSDDIEQTKLGYVSKTNYANRGCMAQNGARCLSDKGWSYDDILRFFYGADINIETAEGGCVSPKSCDTVLDRSGTVIDDKDACFAYNDKKSCYDINGGYDGHLYYTYVWDKPESTIGTWNVNVSRPGLYEIFAYVEEGVGPLSEKAPYTVRASGIEKKVQVDLNKGPGWVSIGKFDFALGGDQWVKLSDSSGEPYTDKSGKRVLFDAIKFVDAVACSDECATNEKRCSADNGVQTCHVGESGCMEWFADVPCGDAQVCNNGICEISFGGGVPCSNECEAYGRRECFDNGVRVCGNFDDDSCLEWSGVIQCSAGQTCSGGYCGSDGTECQNECPIAESKCEGSGYVLCGNYDSDACLEWSRVIMCRSGEMCKNGACVHDPSYSSGGSSKYWDGVSEEFPEKCITEINGQPSVIIDEKDGCFVRTASANWSELVGYGYEGHLYYAYANYGDSTLKGRWYFKIKKGGMYSIYAHIEKDVGTISREGSYVIKAGSDTIRRTVDFYGKSGWFHIGDYAMNSGWVQYIQLEDGVENAENSGKRILFDAIQIVPKGSPIVGKEAIEYLEDDTWDQNKDGDDGKERQGDAEQDMGGNGGDVIPQNNDSGTGFKVDVSGDDCSAMPYAPISLPWGMGILAMVGGCLYGIRRRKQ